MEIVQVRNRHRRGRSYYWKVSCTDGTTRTILEKRAKRMITSKTTYMVERERFTALGGIEETTGRKYIEFTRIRYFTGFRDKDREKLIVARLYYDSSPTHSQIRKLLQQHRLYSKKK